MFHSLTFLQTPANGGWLQMALLLSIPVLMYFFLIAPQRKKQKQLKEMRTELGKGDKVVTQGGIFGTIVEAKDTYFLVEIDHNTKIRVARDFIFKDPSDIVTTK